MLFLVWNNIAVQADECDGLRQQVASMPHDSLRLQALEQIYYCSLENDDIDLQLRCVDDYVAEARLQHSNMEGFGLATKATLFYNYDMNDSVLIAVPRDMERVKELGELTHYYEMWSRVANTYIFMNHNKQGLIETQKMYEDAKDMNNIFGMGLSKCIMGTAYANLRNYDQSIEAFQKSIELLSTLHPSSAMLPECYTYYGNALNDMKAYRRLDSLTHQWHDFLATYVVEHHVEGTPIADINWGYYYLACAQASLGLDRLDDAMLQLDEAYTHIGTTENYQGMNWLYLMAQLCLRQGALLKALNYNNQRMDLLDANGDQTDRVIVMQQRAEIMLALYHYEEAAELYREINIISDSLNAQDTKTQLNEMSTIHGLDEERMANERLQMNNERLHMESERSRFRFIIIMVGIIVLSLAIFLFFRIRAARRLKQAHEELQTAYDDLQAANNVIEQTTAAKERIESELRIARDIQQSMVPTVFPDRPDLDLYASMTPAKEVGGDLYGYLLNEEEDKLYFALGDVSGKGVPASLFMAQATRLFRTLATQGMMPAEICTRMNEALSGEDNQSGMFVTFFLGLLDLRTGHLDFCNAGHNPPVLMKKRNDANEGTYNTEFLEMEPNAPIGLWPGLEYVGEEIADIRHQPLFIYTDGLNEAENREQDQFGDDHLLELLQNTSFYSSQQTVEMLTQAVEEHRNGADPNDDLTMMCVYLKNKDN